MHFLIWESLSFNLMYITACYPVGTTISKTSSLFTALLQHYIEFIDLHSIFKDNSVISSIPNYFNNSETPIICYKYNKPIRSTIFNFNKIVNDLDIDSNTPAS